MDLKALCFDVIEIAREVGIYIKMQESQLKQKDIETKSLNSLVSYVDKTAEKKIIAALKELLPESGFIAEEGTDETKGEKYHWIIDPLDGTTNFIHGIPMYSVSIALQENDQIVLGVVFEVSRDECFYAWKGGLAYMNTEEISVSKTKSIKDSLVATGFPYYDFKRQDGYFESLKHFANNSRGIRRMGSAAIDLVYVACGRFDLFYEYSLHPWDVAAGAFIVTQAGGKITDFQGGNNWLHGKEIIASNETLHSSSLAVIKAI